MPVLESRPGDRQVNRLAVEGEPVEQVDVIGPGAIGDDLEPLAVEVEDVQAALLVGAETRLFEVSVGWIQIAGSSAASPSLGTGSVATAAVA